MLSTIDAKLYNRIIVVGDIHGDYSSLNGLLELIDFNHDLTVFLGDYGDRGTGSIETIRKIIQLQKTYPNNIIALKGNHEDFTSQGIPKFHPCSIIEEAAAKTKSWEIFFKEEFKPFIDSLSIAAILPNVALLVHAGISGKIKCCNDLKNPTDDLLTDLLWSDPFEGLGERFNQKRGIGVEFGENVTNEICQRLMISKIIRSHQPAKANHGPTYEHHRKVITVQSTSAYGGTPFIYFLQKPNESDPEFKFINILDKCL